MAAISGSLEITRFIISKSSSLYQTKKEGKERVINAKDNDSHTPLVLAMRIGHIDAARYLAISGADLRIQDKTGRTALHYAVLT